MLSIILLREGVTWKIMGEHHLHLPLHPKNPNSDVINLNIPNGFITDLDTIPRVPIIYGWLKNRTAIAAAWHDYLYQSGFNRKWADQAFLYLMEKEGVRRRYRLPIYWGVRLFGRFVYKRKQEAA